MFIGKIVNRAEDAWSSY